MRTERPRRFGEQELREYALRLLAGRALSSGELKEKLRRKADTPASVDNVMKALASHGFTDDARYAEHFSTARAQSGAYGRRRVLSDLLKKRVARGVAEKAVQAAYEETDESAQITQWLERKYRGKDLRTLLQDPRQLSSAYRRLRLAGFTSGPAIRVLKRYASQADELEGMEDADASEPKDG